MEPAPPKAMNGDLSRLMLQQRALKEATEVLREARAQNAIVLATRWRPWRWREFWRASRKVRRLCQLHQDLLDLGYGLGPEL
jgi:hypothetical protein